MPVDAASRSINIPDALAETHGVRFVVHSRLKGSVDQVHHHLPDHKRFLKSLHDSGKLGPVGPFFTREGKNTGNGFYALKVDSWDEAERIAATDPFHQHGIRMPQVEAWLEVTDWSDRYLQQ